ncbi:hypothetical protein [Phytoactinopolyspora halotolerans]|uniref:2OG-Fe(II) oxygenase n=1 Tax=Phytoactinopolyspora halotolerans TaxID=1981512 RepID=A0A6L9S9J1_9ACTN|nr:hypothetical protein [Phytoactinopolyspora halotolerans]NEE01188.1 hypothetical protein [Phytoactinopolyspora halotolerans]
MQTDVKPYWWGPALGGAPTLDLAAEVVQLREDSPSAREDGSVIGAARMTTTRVASVIPHSAADLQQQTGLALNLQSMWLNTYTEGDFAALHVDRPDAVLTGLLAVGHVTEPLVVCPELIALNSADLLELAALEPFPRGESLTLSADRFLFLRGAAVPHHRPPVNVTSQVLTVTFAPKVARGGQ